MHDEPDDAVLLLQVRAWVGWTDADSARLASLRPHARAREAELLDRFYRAIRRDPEGLAVFSDPDRQIPRQREQLALWLHQLLETAGDDDGAIWSRRVGRIHVEHGMPQRFMITAMAVIEEWLIDLVFDLPELDPEAVGSEDQGREEHKATLRACHRACQVQLAIMMESYRIDYQAQMRQQERMATVGEMAEAIATGLRAPLAALDLSLRGLSDRRPVRADPRAVNLLEGGRRGLDRADQIVGRLEEFVRVRTPERRPVTLDELARRVASELPLSPAHRLGLELQPGLPDMRADEEQLAEVLRALLRNALAASPHGGEVVISLREYDESGDDCVIIEVRDSGEGIPTEDLERVFDPRYSTGALGVGLGLPLSRQVVEAHGGRMWIESTPGVGTRARVVLPLDRSRRDT